MADIFGDDKLDEIDSDDEYGDEEPVEDDEANPAVTRQEERVINNEVSFGEGGQPGYRNQSLKRQLLMVFGKNGEPLVYVAENGRPTEQPRPPTAEEFALVKSQGYFLKGGIVPGMGEVPAGQTPTGQQQSNGLPWGWMALAAIVTAGAGYAYYRSQYDKGEEDADEIDDGGKGLLDEDEDEDLDAHDVADANEADEYRGGPSAYSAISAYTPKYSEDEEM